MANTFIDEKNRSKEEFEALEVAESAREVHWENPSFVADLFMGRLNLDPIAHYPEQDPEDKKIGDDYIARLRSYCEKNLDGEKVDVDGQIPDSAMKGLAELGAFAMKIPKKYGGMELSQINYNRALSYINSVCSSTAATLSAHQSIGVPQPLLLFGTDEQKAKYLPRFAKGEVSAFALTEPDVGSDPAKLATIATPIENGNAYLLNGLKLWCTNGAIADILVVMAQTPPVVANGREKKQITAFIVEKNMPGFEVIHRCRFLGLNGIQNALLKFTNLRVPKENVIWGLGKGLKLALVTLNAGRLSLPACCIGGGKNVLEISRDWGNERKQWGAAVGEHEAGAQKLASFAANQFALESVTWLAGAWVDNKSQDIRLEAAMCKYFASLRSHQVVDDCLQFRGGRGYERASSLKARGEKPIPVERWLRDSRINQIVEGTNEIMRLFISREALDKHLAVAGDVINPKAPLTKKLVGLLKAGLFYAFWYPRQWVSFSCWPRFIGFGKMGTHLRFVKRNTKRLARSTFHLMVLNGPKLEKKQIQLQRVVDIATDLFAMAATIGRAHRLEKSGKHPHSAEMASVFCWEARSRIRQNFCALMCNDDQQRYRLGRKILKGDARWLESYT